MQTTIQKWGNSQVVSIPKSFLDALGMAENDTVDLIRTNDNIIITKTSSPKYPSLKERMEAFYGKPIDEIYVECGNEISTGNPVGGEVW